MGEGEVSPEQMTIFLHDLRYVYNDALTRHIPNVHVASFQTFFLESLNMSSVANGEIYG